MGRTPSFRVHDHHRHEEFFDAIGFMAEVVLQPFGDLTTPLPFRRPAVWEVDETLHHHHAEGPDVDSCGIRRRSVDLGCKISSGATHCHQIVAFLGEAKVGELDVDAVLASMAHKDVSRANISMYDGGLAPMQVVQC
jgi:hypothetical protein